MSINHEKREKDDDPFANWQAGDGVRIQRVQLPSSGEPHVVSLWVGLFSDGVPISVQGRESLVQLCSWKNVTSEDLGASYRAEQLARAVASYYNAGGNRQELQTICQKISDLVGDGLTFGPYYLLHTGMDADLLHTKHVFVRRDSDECVVWLEGCDLYRTDVYDLLDNRDHDEDDSDSDLPSRLENGTDCEGPQEDSV